MFEIVIGGAFLTMAAICYAADKLIDEVRYRRHRKNTERR